MNYYTVTQLAAALGIPKRRVRYHCGKVGVPKAGQTYLITAEYQEPLLRAIGSARPGRKPRKQQ